MVYKKLVGWLAGLLATAAIGIWYGFQQAMGEICGNTEAQTVVSPDGQLQAVVFERDCGATTGLSTQVSVFGTNQNLPNEGGNVFVTDASDASMVRVAWSGARTLQVQYPAQATVFHQATAAEVSLGLFRRAAVTIHFLKTAAGTN